MAHADVVKAQIQVQQRQRDIQEAQLAVQKAKINLGVLMFPVLQIDYSIVDDLSTIAVLPPLPEATARANAGSPDLRAAQASVTQARQGVSVARYAYLPSFGLDFWYGINANQLAAHDRLSDASDRPQHVTKLPGALPAEFRVFCSGYAQHSDLDLGLDPQQSEAGEYKRASSGARSHHRPEAVAGGSHIRLRGSANGAFASGIVTVVLGSFE